MALNGPGAVVMSTYGTVSGLGAGHLAFFQPSTIAGDMNAALAFVTASPDNPPSLGLAPVKDAFCEKYGIDPTQRGPDRISVVAKAMVEPRFTAALLDKAGSARSLKPEEVVSKFLDGGYNTVPFDALITAGLVTHGAVSSYLRGVSDAAENILLRGNAERDIGMIEEYRARNKIVGEIVKPIFFTGLIAAVLGLTTMFVAPHGSASGRAGACAGIAGLFMDMLSIAGGAIFTRDESTYEKRLTNATVALLALQRQRSLIEEAKAE